ncbi:patatin-like phospholipase family protein [Bacteroidota bacterium]
MPFIFLILLLNVNGQINDTLKLDSKLQNLPYGLSERVPESKPQIGLALSGGGSRSISQLGVLLAFEERGIPIDYIVGTSMGGIIGGLYSAGYKISEIDSIFQATNWDDLLSLSETSRKDFFVDKKVTEDMAIFSIRFDGLNPVIPTSLVTGQKVLNYLNLLAFNAPLKPSKSFDDLLFRYRAVSTDLITGNSEVIKDGSFSKAMRASSSVTFLLAPVRKDSMLLVDGGLVANVPVVITRELGCDYVVAVNTTSPLRDHEELIYPWTIADQVVSIPISIISNQNLDNADMIISPELGGRNNNDFSNLGILLSQGYKSAVLLIDSVESEIRDIFISSHSEDVRFYKNIQPNNPDSKIEKEFTFKYTQKDSVSRSEILYDMYKLLATGDYSDVSVIIQVNEFNTFLMLNIDENHKISDIEIQGVNRISQNEIRRISDVLIGVPYNSRKIIRMVLDLLKIYRQEGYSLAKIDEISFNRNTGLLNIAVSEGIIDEILIEGNKKTSSSVILREFPLKEGEPFLYKNFELGLENLRTTNLFNELDVSITQELNKNVLKIKLIEKLSAVMRFGLKTDNENFTQLSLDLREENLFGTGTELGTFLLLGPRKRIISLEHQASRIFDTYLTYKIKGFYLLDDINTYSFDPESSNNRFSRSKSGEYRQKHYGVSVGIGTQVEKFGNLIAEGIYQIDELENRDDDPISPYRDNFALLRFSILIDSQNKIPYPTDGFFINGYYETSQQILGSDLSYTKFEFLYKYIFTLEGLHTLSMIFNIGFGDETLPLAQHFSFGGQNSFYGYREYDFRGRQIFRSSVEYQLFLPFQIFFDTYLRARYDLGSIWSESEQIKFKDLRHGIGATLSLDTPIGPADFSIGKSFLIKKGLPESTISWGETLLYFTIGYYY